jgi:CRISPR-associated RAMP protein (TIGR02581 family)
MFDVFKSRLELSGILTTVTALRISQGRSTEPIGSDLPVVKDSLGRPLIPGASFKGALRSRLESFLRGIEPELAVDPSELVGPDKMRWLKEQKQLHENDAALTAALLKETDLASLVFGSPWAAGKFQVRDLTVLTDAWFGQYQERDGVSIDRDTETAAEGKLYDFQVVPAGTPFEFKAVVENAEDWELGLLMIGLHQFENEMIPLGGGRSRGLGVVKLQLDEMIWVKPSNPQDLMDYLKHLVDGQLQPYVKSSTEIETLKSQWTTELLNQLPRLAARETTHA